MPISIYLEARRDYKHAIIKDNNNAELVGTGSVNGHEGKITGSSLLWIYRPAIPAAEIGIEVMIYLNGSSSCRYWNHFTKCNGSLRLVCSRWWIHGMGYRHFLKHVTNGA
jgi:hypothetical protein